MCNWRLAYIKLKKYEFHNYEKMKYNDGTNINVIIKHVALLYVVNKLKQARLITLHKISSPCKIFVKTAYQQCYVLESSGPKLFVDGPSTEWFCQNTC